MRDNHWTERGEALAAAYLELAQSQTTLNIAPFKPIIGPYHTRPFTTINADEAVAAAHASIIDPTLKALPIIGSLDQISDLTPLLEDPKLSQKMMRQLHD